MSAKDPGAGSDHAPIAPALLAWYDEHGRSDLPWKHPRDAYRIWVSEIMLQQTQVATALPYFERFMARFPDVTTLANAPLDDVLAHWSGLGYYARARNLHAAARRIVDEHAAVLPRSVDELEALPGIGRSTAGAIAAMAWDVRAPILDGNVKRVLARLHAVDRYPGERATLERLWAIADAATPKERVADYTQAIMDLGATLCTRARPACERCPLSDRCQAFASGRTAELPVRKPRKAKPERETRMLVVEDPQGRVLLERRPPSGIWGGLWCLPQLDDETAEARDHLAERLALSVDGIEIVERWAPVSHTFTHFVLHIRPLRLRLALAPDNVRDEEHGWFAPAQIADLGLAAPVRRLLQTLTRDDLLG